MQRRSHYKQPHSTLGGSSNSTPWFVLFLSDTRYKQLLTSTAQDLGLHAYSRKCHDVAHPSELVGNALLVAVAVHPGEDSPLLRPLGVV